MARVQTAEAMGNSVFDPGVAQSVLSNKDIASREKMAMASNQTQSNIAAGEQQASMSNAATAANASMFNTAQNVAGEKDINRQRIAAEQSSQLLAQEHEKRMKMMDEDLNVGLTQIRGDIDMQLQKAMQSYQDRTDEKKYKWAMDAIGLDQQWGLAMYAFQTKAKLGMLREIQKAGATPMEQVSLLNKSIQEEETLQRGLDSQANGAKYTVDPDGSTMVQAEKDYMEKGNGTRTIFGNLFKNNGLDQMGFDPSDLAGGPSAIASKLAVRDGKGNLVVQPIQLAMLYKTLDSVVKNISVDSQGGKSLSVKDELLLKTKRAAQDALAGITMAGAGKDKDVKSLVEGANIYIQGTYNENNLMNTLKRGGGVIDVDKFMGDLLNGIGLNFSPDNPMGRRWNSGMDTALGMIHQLNSEGQQPQQPHDFLPGQKMLMGYRARQTPLSTGYEG